MSMVVEIKPVVTMVMSVDSGVVFHGGLGVCLPGGLSEAWSQSDPQATAAATGR